MVVLCRLFKFEKAGNGNSQEIAQCPQHVTGNVSLALFVLPECLERNADLVGHVFLCKTVYGTAEAQTFADVNFDRLRDVFAAFQ